MKNIFAILTVQLLITLSAFSQQESRVKCMTASDVFFQSGFFSEGNTGVNFSDFKALAPSSSALKNDFTNFNETDDVSANDNSYFSVLLGFKFSDKEKKSYKSNPLLRLGINYISGTRRDLNLSNEERKSFDTLTSNQTGNASILDSVVSQEYRFRYKTEQIFLDASIIFRTNPDSRWSLYSGAGIAAGISMDANTEIRSTTSTSLQANISGISSGTYEYAYTENIKTENYNNKSSFGFRAYIPIGVDFRIGKQNNFWKHTHLFYEIKPGVNYISIPELKSATSGSVVQGMGARFNW